MGRYFFRIRVNHCRLLAWNNFRLLLKMGRFHYFEIFLDHFNFYNFPFLHFFNPVIREKYIFIFFFSYFFL